jgi:ArsR family transcriptional regulator, zinc-responsive transcriptional repressor
MHQGKRAVLMPFAQLKQAAGCLRCIAHPQRLRIIDILLYGGERTVGEVAALCRLPQPATSEHLRQMSARGFLGKERRGRCVYYYVLEKQLESILQCIRTRYGKEI